MYTRLQDIRDNKVKIVDFSDSVFDEQSAKEVAQVLIVNTSAKEIDITASTFGDKELKIVAEAIIKRPAELDKLKLRHDDLITDKSVEIIAGLIESGKVLEIDIFNTSIINSEENTNTFKRAIKKSENKVNLITSLPINIKDYTASHSLFSNKNNQDSLVESVIQLFKKSDESDIREIISDLPLEITLQIKNVFESKKDKLTFNNETPIKGH